MIDIKCKNCGKIFFPNGREKYLCDDCAAESKRKSVVRERICKICGTSFMGYPRSFFCPECSKKRKKQQKKIYNQRNPERPLGSVDTCKLCGKQYIANSGMQKYCPECSKEQVQNNIRDHKRKYMAIPKNKEKNNTLKSETRGKRYICAVCGNEFEKHTTEVTCSPECRKEYMRIKQNIADIKRGKRLIPANERYDSGLPKSGVVGVTYHRITGKWQATYKGKYVGLYNTVDQAAKALEEYKKEKHG